MRDGFINICRTCRGISAKLHRIKRFAKYDEIDLENSKKSKSCNKCLQVKPMDQFFRDASRNDIRASVCKVCKTESSEAWRKTNKTRYNARFREYNKKHYHRLRLQRYKLTVLDYSDMLANQKDVCAICKKPPPPNKPFCVDHCHDSGRVRGLLCYSCNRGISYMENSDLFEICLKYLGMGPIPTLPKDK